MRLFGIGKGNVVVAFLRESAAFVSVGLINTALALAVFALLNNINLPSAEIWSQIFTTHVLVAPIAFMMQARFVFRKNPTMRSGTWFLLLSTLILLANQILFPIIQASLGLDDLGSQAIALLASAILAYLGGRFVTFRRD